jgi:BexC/CtrB/KpsE family polysaccharide export inner-membrane protein
VLNRLKPPGLTFIVAVLLPTLAAIAYFGFLASDIYISESRFVVRSPEKSAASPLGMILNAGGFASANEENFAVVDYVRSREALADVNRDQLVSRSYGSQDISSFDRYGGLFGQTSNEHLYKYFTGKVSIELDTSSQVTTLTVRAFKPGEAKQLNERLLLQAENLVNRLSERGRRDAISSAQTEVTEARVKARTAIAALARYRNQSGIIDPEKQAAINLQMVSKLQDALLQEQSQLTQLEVYTPKNPQIPAVRTRIKMLKREIERQSSYVAGAPGSLSAAASQYQQLVFDAEFAGKQLAVALASLQEAQNEARKKQVYVERIAEPNLPDYSLEPRRVRGILATFVLGLLAWGVATTLLAGIREHRD